MEYLYRLSAGDEDLLYVGITNDWTRRLREHWLGKPWADEILNVTLEKFPDRTAVSAAERLAIHSERPRYNIQHNIGLADDGGSGGEWTAGDVLLIAGLVVLASYALYMLAEEAITRYRKWKLDREDYLQWKRDRDQQRLSEQDRGQPEGRVTKDQPKPTGDEGPRLAPVKPQYLWTAANAGGGQITASPVTTSAVFAPTKVPTGPLGIVAMILVVAFAGGDGTGFTATMAQPVTSTGSTSPRRNPLQGSQQDGSGAQGS